MTKKNLPTFAPMPNTEGYFDEYGGSLIPERLLKVMQEIGEAYQVIKKALEFKK